VEQQTVIHIRRIVAILTFVVLTAGTSIALAEPRDPLNYPLRQWLAVLAMTIIGGLSGWYIKVRRGDLAATNIFALIGEMTVSALAGAIVFFLCDYGGVPIGFNAAASGLAGYMGGRAIDMLETHLLKRAGFTPDRRSNNGHGTRSTPLE
jgi:hypothetical protein